MIEMKAPRITAVRKRIGVIHFKSASNGFKLADRDLFVCTELDNRALDHPLLARRFTFSETNSSATRARAAG
jgi:hypothetical protein